MFILDGKVLQPGIQFEDAEGNKYPPQWLYQTTLEQKEAIGITEVPDPAPVDTRFYWDANTPKALEDVTETVDDKEYTTKGLKTQFTESVKLTARNLLDPTDWMIVRKYERDIDVDAEVLTERAAILAEETRLEAAIAAVTTVEELQAVLNDQRWPINNNI